MTFVSLANLPRSEWPLTRIALLSGAALVLFACYAMINVPQLASVPPLFGFMTYLFTYHYITKVIRVGEANRWVVDLPWTALCLALYFGVAALISRVLKRRAQSRTVAIVILASGVLLALLIGLLFRIDVDI